MQLSTILLCTFSGVFLGSGWWVYGDGVIDYKHHPHPVVYRGKWSVPGILTTVALVALNIGVTPQTVIEKWEARLYCFACLTLAFVGVGLSVWILAVDDVIGGGGNWTGVSLLVQTMLLLVGGLLFFIRSGCHGNSGWYTFH